MLRISTFGRLALDDESGPVGGAATWRPTLAALAILAASGEQGVPRERLLSLIWPARAPERARNSLKQLLSTLRRFLPDSTITGTGILRLDRAAVSCDLWDFQAALAADDLSAAIGVYSGPFLDGFFLPDAVEFERWAEAERARHAAEFHRALEALAERASMAGDFRGAVFHMRRLAAAEPLNSDVALRLMLAMVASGNRAGALQHFEIHSALVQQELECAPDPAVTEYAATLRAGPAVSPKRVRDSTPMAEVLPAVSPSEGPTSEGASTDSRRRAPDTGSKGTSRARRSAVGVGVAALVLAAATAIYATVTPRGGSTMRREPMTNASDGPVGVAVLPFSAQGGPSLASLGSGIAELLSSSLDGAGLLHSVSPHAILEAAGLRDGQSVDWRTANSLARRVDARYFVLGSVVQVGGRLRIVAYLYDRQNGASPLTQEAVESARDSIFAAVDDLAAKLLAERFRAPTNRLSRAAAQTTTSLTALKSFLQGEEAYRAGRYGDAANSYARAVALDSAFALAYYRLAQIADLTGRDHDVLPAVERALRFAARLSPQDSVLVRAFMEWQSGRLDEAERLYRADVADYPDDLEGWLQLGELLFHGNPLRGRSSTDARTAFERVLALDPNDSDALVHLARIASSDGRVADADSLVRLILARSTARDVLEMRAFRAFALGDRQGQKRVTNELLASPGSVSASTALEVAVYADDLDRVARFGALLTEEQRSPDIQGFGHRLLAQTAVARGQWREAQHELTAAARFDSTAALELRSLLVVLPFLPVSRAELEEVRAALERWRPAEAETAGHVHFDAHIGMHPALRLYRLGLVSARLGDTVSALRYARQLEHARDAGRASDERMVGATFARSIEARVADAAGHPDRALALLESTSWQPIASSFMAEALDRYYRAELLRRLGRLDEARGWYRAIAERTTYELVYFAPSRLQLAQIAEAEGATDRALAHYRRFLAAWRNADAELVPLMQGAQRQLARLAS